MVLCSMKAYIQKYYNHFGIHICDTVWDEYEYIVNERMVVAQNIHHVEFGANKTDDIKNLMALKYDNHQLAHSEQLNRYHLKDVHLQFMNNNPYQ